MSIKVLHIIGSLKLGGAQICLKYLVENISNSEVESFVYPLRCKNIDIPVNGTVLKLPYHNYDPRKFFAILRLCKKHHIDIIHAHLHKPIIGSLVAGLFCEVHVVVHEHGPILRDGLQYSLYRFLLRLLRCRANTFIAVSQITADCLAEKAKVDPQQIHVVYNPVDHRIFDRKKLSRDRLRKQLDVSVDDIVIGFVGRLHPVKGVDLLIEAMAGLLEQSSKYMLVLAGDGVQRETLKKLAAKFNMTNRVKFLGFCDNVPEIMSAFDIGVVPSRQEPFGIVALEYMSMKVPLVCSNAGGLKEFVTDQETALVTAENTPKEICCCINRLVQDTQLQKKLANAAYNHSQQFSVDRYARSIAEIYKQVLR